MEYSKEENKLPYEHISDIFKEYTTPSRVLRSFTNLSNTVIQTALSGQNKFVFEILQNADDAFEHKDKAIEVKFILHNNYLIVHHNGKGFDFNDVERICDYASQIEEVKANDLSKTGYKGLGFKSLFNLSDCIYIYSNGYSFRFDKMYWSDSESKPWQVIPIWCSHDDLPLNQNYSYDQPVNFILRVNNVSQLESQLTEVIDQPELLLYLHRIDKLCVNLNKKQYLLERRVETFGVFQKVDFYKNQHLESTWLSKSYTQSVCEKVRTFISGGSSFIYPAKIKNAKEVEFTFTLRSDKMLKEISRVRGQCYSILPTQLYLSLPYHINSLFILNLDRTQLHENEWNEFLIYKVGSLQFNLLKDLAEVIHLKNHVIELLIRKINHPYYVFNSAFLKGFMETVNEICWIPAHHGLHLLKLGCTWTDDIEFFKQNFCNIQDPYIYPFLIDYDVKSQYDIIEAKRFTYDQLFRDFCNKYYPQLTKVAYVDFISYLYERLKSLNNSIVLSKLRKVTFLLARDGTLQCPENALLEVSGNSIPEFSMINPIDNDYLPLDNLNLIQKWLVHLGARQLTTPIKILQESILEWINSGIFQHRITMNNHIGIINYLAKYIDELTQLETEKLRERLLILTESNEFKLAKNCYLRDTVPIKEFSNIISDNEKISSSYDMDNLRKFFIHVWVRDRIKPTEVLRKSILLWIKNGEINEKLARNYNPIIEYVSLHYNALELSEHEEMLLKENFPVLTCDDTLQKAKVCYFDSAVPNVKGLECVIRKNELVSIKSISKNVHQFLRRIGVSRQIKPIDVIRRSVIKWIQEDVITNRITQDNHHEILNYIGKHWSILNITVGLNQKERNDLKMMPILTEAGIFRAACCCYWPISNYDGNYHKEIPGLEYVISSDEFVFSNYNSKIIKSLLEDLGVHNLNFSGIYEKYSDYLIHHENVKWFFSHLVNHWEQNKSNNSKLLSFLNKKFRASSCLLAKNGKMYSSMELYSSRFYNLYGIDPDSILLLDYKILPEDLERYLGFKTVLDFKCIKQILGTIGKKIELGKNACVFFSTLLEQLRLKDKSEIRKQQLGLLSNENKLIISTDLYYFREEDAICYLDSCYLKRIHGMSHVATLELAELCGVNILPFKQNVKREKEMYDNTLKEFYLERLPFIAVQESKRLNEDIYATLRRLYNVVRVIKLYQCNVIYVAYSFSSPIKILYQFDDMTFYVVGNWGKRKSKIHDYLKVHLDLKTDIRDIIDMEQPITQDDKEEWIFYHKQDPQKFYFVQEELKKLLSSDEGEKSLNLAENIKNVQSHHSDHDEQQPHKQTRKSNLVVPRNYCAVGSRHTRSTFFNEQFDIKLLSEKYVFASLQNHYKDKYPKAQFTLLDGTFTLQWCSHKVQIVWLNANEEKGLSYDLILKKEDEITQFIEVKSTNYVMNNDLFNISHCEFIRKKHQLAAELHEKKIKYFIYHVFYANNSSTSSVEELNKCVALYKIALSKNT